MHFSQKTTLLALLLGLLPTLQSAPRAAQDPGPAPAEEPTGAEDDPLPEGVEEPVARMIEAAGGMEAWDATPGLRFQVLETMRTLQNRTRNDWLIYTRVPMLARLDPVGNGFILSEYAHPEELRPEYRRDVYTEGVAWAEKDLDQRKAYMAAVVLPDMAPRFEPFLEGPLTCATCHGTYAESTNYAMPGVQIPLDTRNWPTREDSAMTKAMFDDIHPRMAELLEMELFDMQTMQGFSCLGCHVRP